MTETEGNSFFKFPVFYPSSIISIPNEEHPTAVFWQTQKTSRKLNSWTRKGTEYIFAIDVCGTSWNQIVAPRQIVGRHIGVSWNGGTQQPWVSYSKNDHFGGVLGVPPFKETPIWIYSALTNHPLGGFREARSASLLNEKRNWPCFPSKIEWDLTNGPLSKLLELLDTKV